MVNDSFSANKILSNIRSGYSGCRVQDLLTIWIAQEFGRKRWTQEVYKMKTVKLLTSDQTFQKCVEEGLVPKLLKKI